MENKYFILIFALLICLPLICAQSSGGFLQAKQNDCIQLPQECPNCTFVKLTTVTYPDLSQIGIQENMFQNGTSYNYSFCNTSQLGSYSYCTLGDIDGAYTTSCNDFSITPSGKTASSGEATVYIFLIFIVLFFFLLCLIGGININSEHEYDIGGKLLQLKYGAYLKMGLLWLSSIFLWILLYLGWEISNKVLMFAFIGEFFHTAFSIMTWLLAPVFIAFVILALIKWTADLELHNLTKRGLRPR